MRITYDLTKPEFAKLPEQNLTAVFLWLVKHAEALKNRPHRDFVAYLKDLDVSVFGVYRSDSNDPDEDEIVVSSIVEGNWESGSDR